MARESWTMHGEVNPGGAATRRIIVATDAAVADRHMAMAYVASDGRYGLSFHPYQGHISGTHRTDVAELRAIMFALERVFDGRESRPVRVLTDSRNALAYVTDWKAGEDRMPPGYDIGLRSRGLQPTLIALSRKVLRHQMITVRLVRGHAGHPLNETADSLAKLGLRTLRGWCGTTEARSLAHQWVTRGLLDCMEKGP
ncbi:ribonuclease HI [Streptomyces cucumeris]|uniref:ribonuclease HI n=1 Tax=Streptomyces cucumeris TaxID=2962890 RepID=UPI0020C8A57A|nr:RNase H family protein [Streptomyces sp. NEAU-Y11]MCP9209699.1 hypothetical protein [Streptomyces sp. NEAU-Y11]